MENETTTDAPVEPAEIQHVNGIAIDDQGMAISQAEDNEEQAPAVDATSEQQTEEATNEPSEEDEQLAKFAANKGLELDSENARKAAKMAMNAEKLMHDKTKRASELESTMSTMSDESAEQIANATGQNPEYLKRLQRMEVKDSIREFWDSNPDARQYESEMADIAVNSGLYGSPEAILNASYAIALSKNSSNIKSQGKQEALKSLAQKQQAAVPRGSAVNSSMTSQDITPQNVDRLVGQNSQDWFVKNYDAINKAMAS